MAADIKNDIDEFISKLKKEVLIGNKNTVLSMVDNESFKNAIQTDSFDIIRIICELLNENREEDKQNFLECCEYVIATVSENSFPEEILLELIEQAEYINNDTFLILVIPMQRVVLRLPDKLSQSLEWVLNTIHRYVYSLSVPEDYKFEDEEQLLLENDDTVIQITHTYNVLLDFYAPFITEATDSLDLSKKIQLKQILLQSLTHLLGKPVPFLDLTADKSKSVFRNYVEKIISWIVSLIDDIFIYLVNVEKHDLNNFQVVRDKDDHFVNCDVSFFDFLFCDKFPTDAVGVFYYMVFFENVENTKLPCVYSAKFVFENCLFFSLALIETRHSLSQFKGLLLAVNLVERLDDDSITYEALELLIHRKLFQVLSKHSVYNEVEKIRKLSLKTISICFKKYDCKSKYLILFNLEKSIKHSGLLGYLITFIKDIVVLMLNSHLDVYVQYFSGKHLFDLMKKYCRLPHGCETDLINVADIVISSLNLIRFLVIRDKQNISGIWDYINEIEKLLFIPLRQGLVLSRAHYDLKLKELKNENSSVNNENTKMSVRIGKEQLELMSKAEQISVINSALNVFDLIESILSRVNECISMRNN